MQLLYNNNSKCTREDTIVNEIKKKQFFGELSFFSNKERECTAKASEFCRIYKIKRADFLDIIR